MCVCLCVCVCVCLTSVASWTADTPGTLAGRCQRAAALRPSHPRSSWRTQRRVLSAVWKVHSSHSGELGLFLSPVCPKHSETWPKTALQAGDNSPTGRTCTETVSPRYESSSGNIQSLVPLIHLFSNPLSKKGDGFNCLSHKLFRVLHIKYYI